jgi:hypothetical protein
MALTRTAIPFLSARRPTQRISGRGRPGKTSSAETLGAGENSWYRRPSRRRQRVAQPTSLSSTPACDAGLPSIGGFACGRFSLMLVSRAGISTARTAYITKFRRLSKTTTGRARANNDGISQCAPIAKGAAGRLAKASRAAPAELHHRFMRCQALRRSSRGSIRRRWVARRARMALIYSLRRNQRRRALGTDRRCKASRTRLRRHAARVMSPRARSHPMPILPCSKSCRSSALRNNCLRCGAGARQMS